MLDSLKILVPFCPETGSLNSVEYAALFSDNAQGELILVHIETKSGEEDEEVISISENISKKSSGFEGVLTYKKRRTDKPAPFCCHRATTRSYHHEHGCCHAGTWISDK